MITVQVKENLEIWKLTRAEKKKTLFNTNLDVFKGQFTQIRNSLKTHMYLCGSALHITQYRRIP